MPRAVTSIDLGALDRDGWIAVPVLGRDAAVALAEACLAVLVGGDERSGDKRSGGTRRMAQVAERLPTASAVVAHPDVLQAVTHLVPSARLAEVAFRSPRPGFGEQTLHSDDVPLERSTDSRGVTAIVALCDFTGENGATAVVPGSHRRPDLQRRARELLPSAEMLLTGPAGTAFVFSAHLVHRGTMNRSAQDRPALQALWRKPTP